MSRAVELVYGNFGGLSPCVLKLEIAQRIAAEGDDISHGYETSFGGYIERCKSGIDAYDREWIDDMPEDVTESGIGEILLKEFVNPCN